MAWLEAPKTWLKDSIRGGGRTDVRKDGRTKFSLLHRTSVPSGPLRGHCPKRDGKEKELWGKRRKRKRRKKNGRREVDGRGRGKRGRESEVGKGDGRNEGKGEEHEGKGDVRAEKERREKRKEERNKGV